MQRHPLITKDGSHTISVPALNVTYHSVHGAIQESRHVFIEAGLVEALKTVNSSDPIVIFEMGFGTGLNALLTLIESEKLKQQIHYHTIELHPLTIEEANLLNYCSELNRPELSPLFNKLHQSDWERNIVINDYFTLHKTNSDFSNFDASLIKPLNLKLLNLIYYDAFAPAAQPELWTQAVFERLFSITAPGGILVTYCSKGDVRRAMKAAGFAVDKIPGPPGKREMLRAERVE